MVTLYNNIKNCNYGIGGMDTHSETLLKNNYFISDDRYGMKICKTNYGDSRP